MSKSKYFLLFCVSFIIGIFLGSYFSAPVWILFLLAGFFISLIFLFGANKKARVALLLFIFLLFGAARIESEKLSEAQISKINKLNNQNVSIESEISEMPEMKNGRQEITLENIRGAKGDDFISGKIIVYANQYPEYNFSDRIKLEGKIKIPEDFDDFEYKNYLFSKGIYYISYYPKIELLERDESSFYSHIASIRKYANDLIKKIFPQPQAGIVSAMTLGVKSNINPEILDAFNRTGTRHIIAISGLHMTIVAVTLMYLLLALGLKRDYAFYFSTAGIVFFVTLVGFPSSAVRAAIMGGLVLLAVKVGRLTNAGNAIISAACLMLLYNPNLLRYDVGFQLSFSAVLGIIYIFPKFSKSLEKYPDPLGLKTISLITISAQVATLPIILNGFGSFSLTSVFANVLILPFVPAVMLGGFLTIIAGYVSLFIAQILSWPIWLILFYQIEVIKFFSSFDFGLVRFENAGFWLGAIYYGVLILALNYKKSLSAIKKKSNFLVSYPSL